MNTWEGDVVESHRARVPLALAALALVLVLALSLRGHDPLPVVVPFIPVWLLLIATFDLVTVIVLGQQYRVGGNPRLLALSWGYGFSLTLSVALLVTLGRSVTSGASIATISESSAWLLLARMVGGTALVVTALLPWPSRFDTWLRRGAGRSWRMVGTDLFVVGAALLVVALVREGPVPLPRITERIDGYPALTESVGVGLVVVTGLPLALGLAGVLHRRRVQGLEAWAVVALSASFGGAVLINVSASPYDVAWYGARGLGLAAAVVVLVGLLSDVGHLQARVRDYARRLEQQNQELTEAQDLRDHLVAVVTHDMRNPLAGLSSYLEVLRDDPDLSAADLGRIHARSRLLTRRLTLMTEDLLASASAHEVALALRTVRLRDELEECAEAFPTIEVVVTCPPQLHVEADPLRLQQVLSNLVANAQRHGAPPVHLGATAEDGTARIVVSDAGPGVPADFVPYLFERYTRAEPSLVPGSGLGLALSRRLVERHGGTLDHDARTGDFVMHLALAPRQLDHGSAACGPACARAHA